MRKAEWFLQLFLLFSQYQLFLFHLKASALHVNKPCLRRTKKIDVENIFNISKQNKCIARKEIMMRIYRNANYSITDANYSALERSRLQKCYN